MENRKPLILITNDDGYQAKGIEALIDSVKDLGDIIVVAPDGPRSGMSSAITSLQPLRVYLISQSQNVKVYATTGTPVDCVKLGISELAERRPDIVLSGVNHGSNAAVAVLYSGTMGAAIEGAVFKIPSIGFSLLDHSHNADFTYSKKYIHSITKQVLEDGLPSGTCLNVNIPKGDDIKGIRVCRQTSGQWVNEFMQSKDGADKDIYWLTGNFENDEPSDEMTDEWALANRYVSVVPVKVDMTNYDLIASIKSWEAIL
ncbi:MULTISPECIES: 5'/3'-nucleotidase SurE [Dysgonomonas]|uniref:5'/3'-nucleotidase SurE n=1 Tax=Dysgonomonas TaxID=156973 RepID=UPI00092994D0|nr:MULTISPECIES: 5'/3'-nucleotidase SurE [Dysgonomonas]MBN9300360.1 5'/3'-nucleotidase SurE [Dysgonomonas mossii]OJX64812.1 MAG: 5'/3'-nucleotidase SurE [Dysgonomonas sp. 37-18]